MQDFRTSCTPPTSIHQSPKIVDSLLADPALSIHLYQCIDILQLNYFTHPSPGTVGSHLRSRLRLGSGAVSRRFLSRRLREALGFDVRPRRVLASSCTTNHLLSFSRVVSSIVLQGVRRIRRVLASKITDLSALRIHDIISVGQMMINEFLIGNVDYGSQEDNAGCNERESPEWHDPDKIVGEQRSKKSLDMSIHDVETLEYSSPQ